MSAPSSHTAALAGAADAPGAAAAGQVRVWDIPTRVFHWSFAACFAGAWLTADSERLRDLHLMLGYTFAGLLAFRLVWGFIGTRHARFADFLFAPRRVASYLRSLLTARPEHYVGHNPAGAVAIFAMLALGACVAASGYATFQEIGGEWLEELHEGAASVMLAIVAIHIAGVAVSSLLHRENLAAGMITGLKTGRGADGVGPRRIIGAALLAAVLGFWVAWLGTPGLVDAPAAVAGEHDRSADDD